MAQNFISKTAAILYSIRKGISKIYQLKDYGSLKSLKSIKIQSYIHLYSFILWWVKMTKVYLLSFLTFTWKEVRGTHLVFFRKEISRFCIWNFESGGSLGRKALFFQLPWDTQNFQESQTLFILMLSFWQTFQNNLNSASTSNIWEVIKFYNLNDKTFWNRL